MFGGHVSLKRASVSCHTATVFKGKLWYNFTENGLNICRGISFNPDIYGLMEMIGKPWATNKAEAWYFCLRDQGDERGIGRAAMLHQNQ